jgi:hypothetical protein
MATIAFKKGMIMQLGAKIYKVAFVAGVNMALDRWEPDSKGGWKYFPHVALNYRIKDFEQYYEQGRLKVLTTLPSGIA